jgi:hypothetical protein
MRIEREYLPPLPGGQRLLGRTTIRLYAGGSEAPLPPVSTFLRIAFSTSATVILIVVACGVLAFHRQLGIDTVTATRITTAMIVSSLVLLYGALFMILRRPRARSRKPNLSELKVAEFQKRARHLALLERQLRILVHIAWVSMLGAALSVALARSSGGRVGGLISGTGVGALALFIRGTVMPLYRHAEESARRYQKGLESSSSR